MAKAGRWGKNSQIGGGKQGNSHLFAKRYHIFAVFPARLRYRWPGFLAGNKELRMVLGSKFTKVLVLSREIFFIILGLALYALAWNLFILPNHIVGGGFGGICAMLFYLYGIPMSISYMGFNVILCIIAYIVLGQEFSIKTVFGILGLTLFLQVIPIPSEPILADKLLNPIMGGIIGGFGVGTYLLQGASTGGSDIVVMIISKYKNLSWGRVYLLFDLVVITSSYFLPSSTLETVAYGFVFMGVSAYTVDMVHNGRRQSVQMFIFTTKYKKIANQIIYHHHRGCTLFDAVGWYTKTHRKIVYLVTRKRESQAIYKMVKAIDADAFITVSNVTSVFGIGFDAIKAGFTKTEISEEGIPNEPSNIAPLPPELAQLTREAAALPGAAAHHAPPQSKEDKASMTDKKS